MTIKTLEGISLDQIVSTFNKAFAEYFVPVHLSKNSLIKKMAAENIRLKHSAGVFDNDDLVGFILCGLDTIDGEQISYNGGTGVIPEFRGNNLTGKMYAFLFDLYKEQEVKKAILEVIDNNEPAIKAYTKAGFKTLRAFECVKGKINLEKKDIALNILPRQIKHPDWTLFPTFWDCQPSWSHSTAAVQRIGSTAKILGLFIEETLIAYGILNIESGRILQFAVHPEYRSKGVGTLLFYYLSKLGNPNLSIINIDKADTNTITFLNHIGFRSYIGQFEMSCEI